MASQQQFKPPLSNPALYTNQHHEVYMGASPELSAGPDECVVHVKCNGICGSDIHFWKGGGIGPLTVDKDYVLGHEGSGMVVWTGARVSHLNVGDRVAIEPGVPCEQCFECSSGNYNLCADVAFTGVYPYNGSIRRYHVHAARFLHRIPDNLSFADGALLEPLSVVLHGFERSPIRLGESTVVCGAGPIGLIALACARASGASPIVVTDLDRGRLDFAVKFVPGTIAVQIRPGISAQEMAAVIRQALVDANGLQPRVVYECTGVQSSVVTASYLPRPTGEVMVIGVGKSIMNDLPFMHMSLAEVDLKFINRYHHSWPAAIRLLSNGILDLKPLITHRYSLDQAVEAIKASADRSSGSIKIHIEDSADPTLQPGGAQSHL